MSHASSPNQKNQPNLDLYLVRRYKICHFLIMVLYLCIGQNRKIQPNLVLYLVRTYKMCHFPLVVSYLCIGQNQNNQPNLVLYLVRRSNILVSVATLLLILASSDREFLRIGRSLVKYYVLHETEIQCQMAKLSYQQIIRLRGLGVR